MVDKLIKKKLSTHEKICYNSLMNETFINYGINLSETEKQKFKEYADILLFYNEKFNITAITDLKQIYIKHFVDSLKGKDILKCGQLLDVGSGGGFPAVPLKIVNENLSVTMLEATGKKCLFLKEVVKNLDLKNVEVINGRAEEYAFNAKFREKFDLCSARAVARLNILCEYCLPFVKIGGKFVAYKGDSGEEVKEAENAIKTLGGKLNVVEKFLIEDEKRSLVVIDKIKNTDGKYPRSNGKIRKSPL